MRLQRKHKLKKVSGYPALIAVLGRASIESKVTPLASKPKKTSGRYTTKGITRKRRKK